MAVRALDDVGARWRGDEAFGAAGRARVEVRSEQRPGVDDGGRRVGAVSRAPEELGGERHGSLVAVQAGRETGRGEVDADRLVADGATDAVLAEFVQSAPGLVELGRVRRGATGHAQETEWDAGGGERSEGVPAGTLDADRFLGYRGASFRKRLEHRRCGQVS
jgi:hypothetical protein